MLGWQKKKKRKKTNLKSISQAKLEIAERRIRRPEKSKTKKTRKQPYQTFAGKKKAVHTRNIKKRSEGLSHARQQKNSLS